jgi:D-beta-D-heptose 7-phosphate kinase/D-beta-D-heptose 1-phosphate adenosyltransferase
MNILVIGESCIDRWIYCKIDRLCPEAPVPVLNPVKTVENPGMAANVKENLLSLIPYSEYHNIEILTQDSFVEKTRFLDEQSGQMIMRLDENDSVNLVDYSLLYSKLESKDWDAVVISCYNKGFLDKQAIEYITTYCKHFEILTFMDAKSYLGEHTKGIDIIKINKKEFLRNDQSRIWDYCNQLIVTDGGKGMTWLNTGINVPVESVEVSNVCGAGDTALAGLVLSFLKDKNLELAMQYANKVAAIAVTKRGVVTVKKEEVLT